MEGGDGQVDLLIQIPSTQHLIIIEFKVIQIDYLGFHDILKRGIHYSRLNKAAILNEYPNADTVLKCKFGSWDKIEVGNNNMRRGRAGMTIEEWIKFPGGPAHQLKSYWNSEEIQLLRSQFPNASAYLVVLVGSRKILVSRMNNGLEEFKLAGNFVREAMQA